MRTKKTSPCHEVEQALRRQSLLRLIIAAALGLAYGPERLHLPGALVPVGWGLVVSWSMLPWPMLPWPNTAIPRSGAKASACFRFPALVLLADAGVLAWWMITVGNAASLGFALGVGWLADNARRFGRIGIWWSLAAALPSLAIVLIVSPVWRAQPLSGAGLWLAVLVVGVQLDRLALRQQQWQRMLDRDLKMPLHSLLATTGLLQAHVPSEWERSQLAILHNSAWEMLKRLDVLRGWASDRVRENFDLHARLDQVMEWLQEPLERRGLELVPGIDPRIPWQLKGDPGALQQLLFLLLSQVSRVAENGRVAFDCLQLADKGDRVWLEFVLRLDEEALAGHSWKAFLAESEEGWVSVLSLAREQAAALGGRLLELDLPGGGGEFRVEVPLEKAGGTEQAPLALAGRSVLVVCDDPAQAESLVGCLETWTLDVLRARNPVSGEWALRRASQHDAPVVALVVVPALAARVAAVLERWRVLGWVTSRAPLLVATWLDTPSAAPAHPRVDGLQRWVENEAQLRNALHAVSVPRGLDDPVPDVSVSPLQVLVADASSARRALLARLLDDAGHRVETVADGRTCLQALEMGQPDLVLLAQSLPDMEGLELFKVVRFARLGASMPEFVLLASEPSESLCRAARQAGIGHLLADPVNAGALLDLMDRLELEGHGRPFPLGWGVSLQPDETVPLIDLQQIERLSALEPGGNLERHMFECFKEDVDQILAQLEQAVDQGEVRRMQGLMQALGGSAANLGLLRLQQVTECWAQRSSVEGPALAAEELESLRRLVQQSARGLAQCFGVKQPRPHLRVVS